MDELLPYGGQQIPKGNPRGIELAEAVSPPGSELLNHDGQSAAKSTAPDYRADQSVKATEGMASAPPLPLQGTKWDWDCGGEPEHQPNHSPKFFTGTHPGGLVSFLKIQT
ncbi:hypothetical protein PGT21_015723 [Puccinia graminis f. sp. tritici]|uniref:Uncharacterized protein n=1 Tax=Puccinia graminis f. sp. tritici TaxID=56615 RepID=A0A5B0PRY2_PUCGR|nr:hypothetical protein PGT21_015723 [Puccinia graminis f. sp. tritici]